MGFSNLHCTLVVRLGLKPPQGDKRSAKTNKSIQMSRHLYRLIITNMFNLSRVSAKLFGKQQIFLCQFITHPQVRVLVGADKRVQMHAAGKGGEGRRILGG